MDYNQIGVALLVVLFLIVSLAMILVVLIQRPQGGGLSGAFGAGGGGQSAFGARTGDALTISTIVVFVLFMGVSIALNFAVRPPEPTLPVAGGVEDPAPAPATLDLDDPTPSAPAEGPESGDIIPTEAPGDGESVPAPTDPDGEDVVTEPDPAGDR